MEGKPISERPDFHRLAGLDVRKHTYATVKARARCSMFSSPLPVGVVPELCVVITYVPVGYVSMNIADMMYSRVLKNILLRSVVQGVLVIFCRNHLIEDN